MLFRFVLLLLTLFFSGCSVTTLRCSTDGDASHVDLVNVPQDIGSQVRHLKDLCGFAFEQEKEPVARLNIIDPNGSG